MTLVWAWLNKTQHTLSKINVKTSLRLIKNILFTTVTILFFCLLAWGGIPRTSLNIPRLSWENLARQSRNSQSELNGTTTLTLDSISWTRFSALGSMRVHIKGAFIASFDSPLRKMNRARAVYFTQGEQCIIMNSYKEYRVQITAKGNMVADNMARVVCWQKIAYRVISYVKWFCILSKKYHVSSCVLPP